MWHRRRRDHARTERSAGFDPLAAEVWDEGHLNGTASAVPVIKAPRAGDLVVTDAA